MKKIDFYKKKINSIITFYCFSILINYCTSSNMKLILAFSLIENSISVGKSISSINNIFSNINYINYHYDSIEYLTSGNTSLNVFNENKTQRTNMYSSRHYVVNLYNNSLSNQITYRKSKYCSDGLFKCIFQSILLGLLIICTIIGNSFVISAVIFERNLHNLGNYLIVSLACSDLTVAVMVMPLGAYQEISSSWDLGKILCDIWTSFDVLSCTASILHLVAIALDRYWAITNLDYGSKRTPKRIMCTILIIWSVSAITALSPHIFGLSFDQSNNQHCRLTDNFYYQLFSTLAAFYLPLIIMCIIYWKIFQAAKFRIRKKGFNHHNTPHTNSNRTKTNLDAKCNTNSREIDTDNSLLNKKQKYQNKNLKQSEDNKSQSADEMKLKKTNEKSEMNSLKSDLSKQYLNNIEPLKSQNIKNHSNENNIKKLQEEDEDSESENSSIRSIKNELIRNKEKKEQLKQLQQQTNNKNNRIKHIICKNKFLFKNLILLQAKNDSISQLKNNYEIQDQKEDQNQKKNNLESLNNEKFSELINNEKLSNQESDDGCNQKLLNNQLEANTEDLAELRDHNSWTSNKSKINRDEIFNEIKVVGFNEEIHVFQDISKTRNECFLFNSVSENKKINDIRISNNEKKSNRILKKYSIVSEENNISYTLKLNQSRQKDQNNSENFSDDSSSLYKNLAIETNSTDRENDPFFSKNNEIPIVYPESDFMSASNLSLDKQSSQLDIQNKNEMFNKALSPNLYTSQNYFNCEQEPTKKNSTIKKNNNQKVNETSIQKNLSNNSTCLLKNDKKIQSITTNNNKNPSSENVALIKFDIKSQQVNTQIEMKQLSNNFQIDNAIKISDVSSALKKKAKIDIKRERKAAKTLGVIMSCFIICWLPFFLMQILFSVCKNCKITEILEKSPLITIFMWSGYANSLFNPIIYTIFSPDFRIAFKKIFFGKYRKRKSSFK